MSDSVLSDATIEEWSTGGAFSGRANFIDAQQLQFFQNIGMTEAEFDHVINGQKATLDPRTVLPASLDNTKSHVIQRTEEFLKTKSPEEIVQAATKTFITDEKQAAILENSPATQAVMTKAIENVLKSDDITLDQVSEFAEKAIAEFDIKKGAEGLDTIREGLQTVGFSEVEANQAMQSIIAEQISNPDVMAQIAPDDADLAELSQNFADNPELAQSFAKAMVTDPSVADALAAKMETGGADGSQIGSLNTILAVPGMAAIGTKIFDNIATRDDVSWENIDAVQTSLTALKNGGLANGLSNIGNVKDALTDLGLSKEEVSDIVQESIMAKIGEYMPDGAYGTAAGAGALFGALMTEDGSGLTGTFKNAILGGVVGAGVIGLADFIKSDTFENLWNGLEDIVRDLGMDGLADFMDTIQNFQLGDLGFGNDDSQLSATTVGNHIDRNQPPEVIAPRDNPHPDIFVPEEPALPEDPALIGEVQTLPEQTTGINVAENQVAGSVLPEEQSHTGFASTDYAGLGANMSERIAASSAAVNTGENPMATASGQSSVTPATSRDFAMAHNGEIQTANLNHAPVEPQMNGTTGVAYTANTL